MDRICEAIREAEKTHRESQEVEEEGEGTGPGSDFELAIIDAVQLVLRQNAAKSETAKPEKSQEVRAALVSCLKNLSESGLLKYKTLLFNLDESLLQESGVLSCSLPVKKVLGRQDHP